MMSAMFAVVKTGGKQYKVAKNDIVVVEKLEGEAGSTVELEQVLMVGEGASATVGKPTVEGATVVAEVVEQTRGPKIVVFKKRRRKHYQRKNGHRQDLTVLRVTDILTGGAKPAKKAAAPKKEEAKKEEPKAAESKAPAKKEEAKKAAPAKKAEAKPEAKKAAAPKKATAPKKAPAKKPAAKKPAAKTKE
jgi:large subunit ribosomal protein L21